MQLVLGNPDRLWSEDSKVWATKHERGWRLFHRDEGFFVDAAGKTRLNLVSENVARRLIRAYERSLVKQ